MMNNSISRNIKKFRKSVGWSQAELARKTNITSAAISQIEKGGRVPSLPVCRKLASAFNINIIELIGDSSPFSAETLPLFFRKFGDILKLSDNDQKIIQLLIDRLKNKKVEE